MKKIYASAIVSAVALTTVASPIAAKSFDDMKNYDRATQQAVEHLAAQYIIQGTSATTFSPQQEIKRRQVVKMLGKYLVESGVPVPQNWETVQRFNDVPLTTADRELLQYAALLYDTGIFVGNNGNINPQGALTRANVTLILNRLVSYQFDGYDLVQYMQQLNATAHVKDIATVKEEAKSTVLAFNALGLSTVSTFNPIGTVKRVHFASFLSALLYKMEEIEQFLQEESSVEQPEEPVEETPTPEQPEEPLEETPTPEQPEKPVEETPAPDYAVISDEVVEATIIEITNDTATVKHSLFGEKTFKIDSSLKNTFTQKEALTNAKATLYIEEDVITQLDEITIQNNGTVQQPIQVSGQYFDKMTDITITSSYAKIGQFSDHYGDITILAPNNAAYTIGTAEIANFSGAGNVQITFTGTVEYDIELHAATINVRVANGANVTSLSTPNTMALTVEPGGTIQDVYLHEHVGQFTLQGSIATLSAETIGDFILNGQGTVDTLFGHAKNVYVQKQGVIVNNLSVTSGIESVMER